MIADELRRQADHFVDLVTLQPKSRPRSEPNGAQRQHERVRASTAFQDEFEDDDAV